MSSIWNKNYTLFKKRFPQLAQMLLVNTEYNEERALEEAKKLWEISPSKAGALTASENGIRLHSAYNPQREAASSISNSELASKETAVFYGFGLGYHVIECARQFPEKKLLIIEPDVNHFFASLSLLDWSCVFSVEKLIFALACPPNQIIHLIEDTSKISLNNEGIRDAVFFDIAPFTAHAQHYFETVRTIIKRNKRKNEINAATLKKFGRLWCRNSLTNLKEMTRLSAVSLLEGKIKALDLPFLICGAGPSLENILPYLKELSTKCVIVCVETALHALLKAGINPDFIVLTDPQFWAYRHIAGLSAPESYLITEISAYPSVFRFQCRGILLCKSQFPIGSWFEEKLKLSLGNLEAGGSVASSAWAFAKFCGAKEVYTTGLDFSFPRGQTHIKGSSAEQSWHSFSTRLNSAEKSRSSILYSASVEKAEDYEEKPVLTDSRMKMFAWWFEARLAADSSCKTYSLSTASMKIPGISPASISQLLSKTDITEKKAELRKHLEGASPCINLDNKKSFQKLLEGFPSEDFFKSYEFLREYL